MISFVVLKIILNFIETNHDCCLAKIERDDEMIFGFFKIRSYILSCPALEAGQKKLRCDGI
jgi:hypothetical protein